MKKLTKLMTAAGCALLIGGGLSLYAATRASGEVRPLADEAVTATFLYGTKWEKKELSNGGFTNSSLGTSEYQFLVFDYNKDDETAKEITSLNAEKNITFTKNGVAVPNLTCGASNNKLQFSNFYFDKTNTGYYLGWLEEGNGLSFPNGALRELQNTGPGDYVMNIPAGLVTFNDESENEEINFSFSIFGEMGATWSVDSQYIPLDNVKEGITITFEEVSNITVTDETVQFTFGEEEYSATELNIEGNKVTLPSLDVEDGSRLYIYFPEGYFKGTGTNGTFISKYIEKTYTVWGGMQTTATVLTKIPSYVVEGANIDLIIQWPGEAVTLKDGAMSGNINVEFNGSSVQKACTIESAGDGTNNLVIPNFLEGVEPGQWDQAMTVSLPSNTVFIADEVGNLPQQVAAFNYVTQFTTPGNYNSNITTNKGIVTVEFTNGSWEVYNIFFTSVSPMIEILDGNNVIANLNQNDVESFSGGSAGFTFNMKDIKGLLPNENYTLRINANTFKLFSDQSSPYVYNPEITATINNQVVLAGYDLGEGTLSPLTPYQNGTINLPYDKPVTSFVVQWDEGETPVYVFDPTKISGKVFKTNGYTMDIKDIPVQATNYPGYGLQVTIPEAFQSSYCKFTFTLEQGLVYDANNQSNEKTEISFETYGEISSDYVKITPAPGQLTSEEFSKVEITWEGFEDDVVIETFERGKGSITLGVNGDYLPIDDNNLSFEDNKLVIDFSYLGMVNQSYDLSISTGAIVLSTDMGDNWVNAYLPTLNYTVWNGMEDAVVEGLTGMVSKETALASDGIYILDWGQKVTPTEGFTVTKNFSSPNFTDQEAVPQTSFTFLDENMKPVTNWEDGGMYLQMNVKELIAYYLDLPEGFKSFGFNIAQGSVIGKSETAINPKQSFGVFEIKDVADKEATISGPEDGIVTIAWSKAYQVASINNAPGIQLLNSNGKVVGEWGFKTDVWQSPIVTYDEESPLQFVINSGDYACGFELNLNALDLAFDTYTVVLPEGALYLVDTSKRNVEGYQPPINALQTSKPFEFGTRPYYEGEITIVPEVGTVAELTTVTFTFEDATEVDLVEYPYVNGKQMTEGFTVEGNVITVVPGINENGEEVTVTIPAGAVIIDSLFTNEDAIVATYTIDIDSGIAGIYAVDGRYEVYTVNGVLVLSTKDASDLNKLENGLYIINGQKVYIRK